MTRPLRIEFAGALYHITARGNARQDIYLTDDDRHQFLELLPHALGARRTVAEHAQGLRPIACAPYTLHLQLGISRHADRLSSHGAPDSGLSGRARVS